MGLLTSFFSHIAKQKAGDPLAELKMLLGEQKLEKLLRESALGGKPIWGELPPSAALPGGTAAAGDIIAPGTVGPTFAEAKALSEIYKNLPLNELISSKAGAQMWSPYQRFLGPPGTIEKMTGETMFPTEKTRTWEQYLPKYLELMEISKTRRKPRREGLSPELGGEEEERPVSEIHKMVPIAQMLLDELRRIYGTLETEKAPKITTFGPEQGVMAGTEVIRKPGKKPRAGILGEYDEWVKTNKGKSLGDYIVWKADAMADAKIKALQSRARSDPDAKKAFDVAKYAVDTYLEKNWDAPMTMDMDQIMDMFLDRYNKALDRIKGRTKAPPKDVLGIQQRLDLKMKEKGYK